MITQAKGLSDPEESHSEAAAGFTYTTAFNLSLTAEFEYNSAAPSRADWQALTAGAPDNSLQPAEFAARATGSSGTSGCLPVRAWQNMVVRSLDLSAFVRRDAESHSREQWIEARYHWSKTEIAMRWQQYSGAFMSVFGSVPQSRRVDFLVRFFL